MYVGLHHFVPLNEIKHARSWIMKLLNAALMECLLRFFKNVSCTNGTDILLKTAMALYICSKIYLALCNIYILLLL